MCRCGLCCVVLSSGETQPSDGLAGGAEAQGGETEDAGGGRREGDGRQVPPGGPAQRPHWTLQTPAGGVKHHHHTDRGRRHQVCQCHLFCFVFTHSISACLHTGSNQQNTKRVPENFHFSHSHSTFKLSTLTNLRVQLII